MNEDIEEEEDENLIEIEGGLYDDRDDPSYNIPYYPATHVEEKVLPTSSRKWVYIFIVTLFFILSSFVLGEGVALFLFLFYGIGIIYIILTE